MKAVSTRKVILFALILVPVICSAILSINLSAIAAQPNNDYFVGGTIIPTNSLLGPWVVIMAVLALIVSVVYQKSKYISS